jgi:hypothetical protein
MRWQRVTGSIVWLLIPFWISASSVVSAEDESAKGSGVFERIGNTAKKVGHKIEQGVEKVAKKVEEKHIGEKVEQKLKKAADKTAEGFTKAGNKIDQKLNH